MDNILGDIEDLKYFRDKLFAALKIPQSYLSRGEGGEEDKTTLAQKDIRFARTIQRLQRSVITELEKIALVHLFVLGYRGDDLISHKISLNNPSRIAELQELEHWKTRFDVASGAQENFFSKRWIAKNLFGMSDEEFLRNQREIFYDRKIDASLEQESEILSPEDLRGIGGGGMAGLGLPGEENMPPPEGGETGQGQEVEIPNAKEQPLLAAPGRRKDTPTTTVNSKGKLYYPVKYDRRDAGARKRNYLAKGANEKGKNTKRNTLGMGALDLFGLANGIYEEEIKNEINREETTKQDNKVLTEEIKKDQEKLEKNREEFKNLKELLNKMESFSVQILKENKKEILNKNTKEEINRELNEGKRLKVIKQEKQDKKENE